MRKKLIVVLAASTIGLSGLAVATPALASGSHRGSTATTSSSSAGSKAGATTVSTVLAGLVTDSTLTQEQADTVAAALNDAGVGDRGKGGHGGRGAPGRDLSTAATALGLSEADLRTALDSGKTLAEIAQTQDVSVDTLVRALVAAETAQIAKDVTAGKLTQAQADKRLAGLTTRVTARVNGTRPADQDTPHGDRGKAKGKTKGKGGTPSATAGPSASR